MRYRAKRRMSQGVPYTRFATGQRSFLQSTDTLFYFVVCKDFRNRSETEVLDFSLPGGRRSEWERVGYGSQEEQLNALSKTQILRLGFPALKQARGSPSSTP